METLGWLHGEANERDPMRSLLRLSDQDSITAGELYGLRIPAELVVLDACETARGQTRQSEGVLSLATAFAYAGAPASLTSLWPVREQASQALMQAFFTHLLAGERKDRAWQLAQQAYLDGLGIRRPQYWAAMIPVGDMAPLYAEEGRSLAWWWMVLAALLLAGAGLWAWRRRSAA